ncbi:TonB-dependent receptor [Maricurvus nonylphenolicus]|uniref:TonB-dependent receptor n=1 Tax=Maricurvus nonylphenolicus TaxID=1008307 RepID=UPI0036F2B192
MKTISPKLLPFAIAASLSSGFAQAEGFALEEIVVTAQKRAQGLQDVPISISAVTGEKIADMGIRDLEEVALYTPNVTINPGQASPNIFIRGIGSGTNAGFEQSVGLYVDGIYSGRGELANVPFLMDVERVEILKGPQGTLFGKNTIGGAINVTSAKPTSDFEGYVEGLYEAEIGEQIYTGVVSGPLTENLGARIAFRHSETDGWVENTTNGREGPDNNENFVRTTLVWDAAEDLEVIAKYEYGEFDRDGSNREIYQTSAAGAPVYPDSVLNDKAQMDFTETNASRTHTGSVTVNYALGDITLTSISGYSAYDRTRAEDADQSPNPALGRIRHDDYEQYSQELRLVSPGGETIDWIAGVYWQASTLEVNREFIDFDLNELTNGGAAPLAIAAPLALIGDAQYLTEFDQETDGASAFAQATWNINEEFRVTLGLRYDEETKELDKRAYMTEAYGLGIGAGASPVLPVGGGQFVVVEDLRTHEFTDLERDSEQWTWSFNTQWDITPDVMAYFSASTGFKSGGFDEAYSGSDETVRVVTMPGFVEVGNADSRANTSDILEYEDEEVLNFEVGAKMSLLDGAAELNVAVFRSEFDDMQVSALVGDVFRVSNAGKSISQGLELDGRWRLSESWTLSGSVAYLDATYDEFDTAPCTVPQSVAYSGSGSCTQDLEGETLLYSPEYAANLSLEYVTFLTDQLELRNVVDVNYQDEFYSALDLDPNTKHDSATKVNLRIALSDVDEQWSVALIAKNITDKETTNFNNDVPFTATGTYFGIKDRPRTIAIQGRYSF